MNSIQKDFLDILKCHINNIMFTRDCNWEEICRLSNIHNLGGMVYTTVNSNEYLPDSIGMTLRKNFLGISAYGLMQERVINNVCSAFDNAGIDHILIKGGVVREYYPYPELRTMGDIDILVKSPDEVSEIMLALGYEKTGGADGEQVFKNANSVVEVHNSLRGMNFKDNVDFDKYFYNMFEHIQLLKGNHTYELEKDYHIIFMLVHMAKHFHNEGCGVRMFLDLAVTLNKFKDSVDISNIIAELGKLRLGRFAENIFKITREFFGIAIDIDDIEIDVELKDKICDYILDGGTFGFENNVHSDVMFRNIKNNESIAGKAKAVIGWMFPNAEAMRYRVKWFKNAPLILLPAAWIYRDVVLLFAKGKIKNAINGSERIEAADKAVKSLGLYDE